MQKGGSIKKRSQASIEAIISVGIVILIFVVMCFLAYDINSYRYFSERTGSAGNLCLRISNALSEMEVLPSGTQMTMYLANEAVFDSGRMVSVILEGTENSGASCTSKAMFSNGTSPTFRTGKGNVVFMNINGDVVVQET